MALDDGITGGDTPKMIFDDVVQPFQLETSNLRGRIVRLGSVIDDILAPHKYPDVVSQLLGETITLTALLSSMLKYKGVFTLQTQGDGPIPMLLSDMTSEGHLRGCATFKKDRLKITDQVAELADAAETSDNQLAQLLGRGHIAFTVDHDDAKDRYQGIVELKGPSLVDCVQHYFTQSEQIGTGIMLAVGKRDGHWRAAGIMLQHMPEDQKNPKAGEDNTSEDDWRRSMILMDSCTEDELLNPEIDPYEMLMRLFHEEGVRVYEPKPVSKVCRCSEEKVENILMMMSEEEREEMAVEDSITMTCEFCSRDYSFAPEQIERKIKDVLNNRN